MAERRVRARRSTPDDAASLAGDRPANCLTLDGIEVVYDDVVLVLQGLSLDVPAGAIVAVLGPNGAGKTTLLRAATGLLPFHRGRITAGRVFIDGVDVTREGAERRVALGVAQALEGRRIFADFTVEENLRIGGYARASRTAEALERVFDLFPVLADRRAQQGGYLSGGEQQMLAIGRALMSDPRYLILDEPSLGLAPMIVEQLGDIVLAINRQGAAVVLVEQNANLALSVADHGYVIEHGRVVVDKPASALLEDDDIREAYLGVSSAGGQRRIQDVKHYQRRRRWLS